MIRLIKLSAGHRCISAHQGYFVSSEHGITLDYQHPQAGIFKHSHVSQTDKIQLICPNYLCVGLTHNELPSHACLTNPSFIMILGMLTNMCVCVYVHKGLCTPILKKYCNMFQSPCCPPPQLLQCSSIVTMLNQFLSLLKPQRTKVVRLHSSQ